MRIAIASDHGGFDQKGPIIAHLEGQGHEVTDYGPFDADSVDYPDYADAVARAVSEGTADRGVLICGTGIGMSLAADKVPGVRAAPIQKVNFAHLFRQHNDGNVLCLSGRFVSLEENKLILDEFMTTDFEGGRHAKRVKKVMREDDPDFTGVAQ